MRSTHDRQLAPDHRVAAAATAPSAWGARARARPRCRPPAPVARRGPSDRRRDRFSLNADPEQRARSGPRSRAAPSRTNGQRRPAHRTRSRGAASRRSPRARSPGSSSRTEHLEHDARRSRTHDRRWCRASVCIERGSITALADQVPDRSHTDHPGRVPSLRRERARLGGDREAISQRGTKRLERRRRPGRRPCVLSASAPAVASTPAERSLARPRLQASGSDAPRSTRVSSRIRVGRERAVAPSNRRERRGDGSAGAELGPDVLERLRHRGGDDPPARNRRTAQRDRVRQASHLRRPERRPPARVRSRRRRRCPRRRPRLRARARVWWRSPRRRARGRVGPVPAPRQPSAARRGLAAEPVRDAVPAGDAHEHNVERGPDQCDERVWAPRPRLLEVDAGPPRRARRSLGGHDVARIAHEQRPSRERTGRVGCAHFGDFDDLTPARSHPRATCTITSIEAESWARTAASGQRDTTEQHQRLEPGERVGRWCSRARS